MYVKVGFYELSAEADNDLEDIFEYTVKEFGVEQAVIYLTSINQILNDLIKNHKGGRTRNEIKEGLYYCITNM